MKTKSLLPIKYTKGTVLFVYEYHFTLGMWIRNNWIFEQDEEYVKLLAEMFGDDSPFFAPDNLSDSIIKSYQRHLRGKKKMMLGIKLQNRVTVTFYLYTFLEIE